MRSKLICNSSNNDTSYTNFVNDIINLDSRQCDDFIFKRQVHGKKINDNDMVIKKNIKDYFV